MCVTDVTHRHRCLQANAFFRLTTSTLKEVFMTKIIASDSIIFSPADFHYFAQLNSRSAARSTQALSLVTRLLTACSLPTQIFL